MEKPSLSNTLEKNSFYPSLKTDQNHSDGHHPFRVTIQMIERKYWSPGMYRQVEAELQKCDL